VVDLRPRQAAGEDRLERRALGVVPALVDVEHEAPRRAVLVVAVARGEHDAEAGQLDAVSGAVVDQPRKRAEADAVGGAAAHHAVDPAARADRLAVAGLEVRARDVPAHGAIRIGAGWVKPGT
jgi:hypothetical protein